SPPSAGSAVLPAMSSIFGRGRAEAAAAEVWLASLDIGLPFGTECRLGLVWKCRLGRRSWFSVGAAVVPPVGAARLDSMSHGAPASGLHPTGLMTCLCGAARVAATPP